MSTSKKRKRTVLSIEDKQSIITRLEKGEKGANLSVEYGVSKQQISDIRKNKDKIMNFAVNVETKDGLKRKSLKVANDEQLDKALYTWFIQQRSTGTPISGIILQEKSKFFHAQIHGDGTIEGEESFKASTGWLDKFKKRHGIRNLSIQGEKLSAAQESVQPYPEELHKFIEESQLMPDQIYNADETGLYWKCMPNRTLVASHEKSAPGGKKSKDRLTVLGCTNATGTHKLKPVLIGKYGKPRCFKNVNMTALPVIYRSQRNAWMNSDIFADWFKNDFVPAVKQHQLSQGIQRPRALLLIDNCSAHPEELQNRDGTIMCMFLPPNTTSLIQPMDQGVLQALKNRYKKKLIQKVICCQDADNQQSIPQILKSHTIKDAVYMLADAWDEGSADSIAKAYRNLKITNNEDTTITTEMPNDVADVMDLINEAGINDELSAADVEQWFGIENGLPTAPQMTDEEIVSSVTEARSDEIVELSDEEDGEEEVDVSTAEAIDCFKKCLSWAEKQNDIEAIQVLQLRRMMDLAVQFKLRRSKQASLFEHFNRM